MANGLRRRLLKLGKDERAATAVEFALLITPLVTLILASLQLSLIFYAGQALQSVAISSGRTLMTGQAQDAKDTQAQFKTLVCSSQAMFLFSCSNIMVDVQSASSYSGVSTNPITLTYDGSGNVTNTFNYSPGGPGDVVILRVMYNWPVVASPLMVGLANQPGGNHLLVGTSVFKNEPYQ
jgi:Flp pilus assembly protein TadG